MSRVKLTATHHRREWPGAANVYSPNFISSHKFLLLFYSFLHFLFSCIFSFLRRLIHIFEVFIFLRLTLFSFHRYKYLSFHIFSPAHFFPLITFASPWSPPRYYHVRLGPFHTSLFNISSLCRALMKLPPLFPPQRGCV